MTEREIPWRDEGIEHGRILLVTDNPISQAITTIAEGVGREVVQVPLPALEWITQNPPSEKDALVICDHDEPGSYELLDHALLNTDMYFVGMVGSRSRAKGLFEKYAASGVSDDVLNRLKVPCGMNLGGRMPGEMALSVVAQIVADEYGRDGRAMKSG